MSDQITPAPVPAGKSEGTAIEQSRAMAEVAAQVRIAQDSPRNIPMALAAMRESCGQTALAERAFFRYPRAGEQITGPSIHLARELARVWGNISYGVTELRRDDEAGVSEMLAYAWDVQTNTRASSIFISPHARDTKRGRKALTELRDVYENNANQGARRVREAIFAVLPQWFTEEAQDRASATLRDGGGKPLGQRVADAIKAFEGIGVTVDQIANKFGDRPTEKWTDHDVAALGVIYKSIQRGEASADAEFPPLRVLAADLTGEITDHA